MPWEVKHLPDKEVVALICSGRFSSNDAREQAEEVIHLLKENKATRVLLDYSNAIGEVPVVDLFYLPEHYDKLGAPKNARVALVLPRTEHRLEDYGFYETVSQQRLQLHTLSQSPSCTQVARARRNSLAIVPADRFPLCSKLRLGMI